MIIVEPNGYNPVLKVIEKVSPYHRAHDEKSYWPPTLNAWFRRNGFSVVKQKFFGVVPFFCPTPIAKSLKAIEPPIEALPITRHLACGTNLVLYRKGPNSHKSSQSLADVSECGLNGWVAFQFNLVAGRDTEREVESFLAETAANPFAID